MLLALLTYLGFFTGVIISNFAKEEILKGKLYLKIIRSVAFASVFYLFMSSMGLGYIAILLGLVALALSYFSPDIILQAFCAIAMREAKSPETFVLVFVITLLSGAYQFMDAKLILNIKNVLLQYLYFPLFIVVAYLI